jgi:signal transduction histidine kinase
MTIFIAFLTYIIVQYKAFNIKLVAAQALVASLIILIGSQFFFIKSAINQILNGITLALSLGFGYLLVKSVKREIQAKEQVEKLANDLDKKNVRLQELDKQKSEFVSFATHQLRSPLTSMKGYASLMLEGEMGPVPEMVKGGIQTILTSTKTLINLVEDYLNISRMELGTMKYSLTEIDFKSLLEEVVREQKTNIEAKGLTFNVDFDANQTYKVKADLDKFKQVLMNTIDNSVKYTPTGSLSISLFKKDGKVIFKVSDTGVGINPAVMVKLFKKFSRAENAHEVNIHGTGLGLFIAREIMNAHKGRIWAESAGEGKGSQFYVELPEVK